MLNWGKKTCINKQVENELLYLKSNTSFLPLPFFIFMTLLMVSIIGSKLQNKETYVPGSFLGLFSIFQTISYACLLYLNSIIDPDFKIENA